MFSRNFPVESTAAILHPVRSPGSTPSTDFSPRGDTLRGPEPHRIRPGADADAPGAHPDAAGADTDTSGANPDASRSDPDPAGADAYAAGRDAHAAPDAEPAHATAPPLGWRRRRRG